MKLLILISSILLSSFSLQSESDPKLKLALLKYRGGGDWYANPTSLPNLARFANSQLGTKLDADYETIEVDNPNIFNYAFVHMTGHGNVVFTNQGAENLRLYLMSGGFLHIDDNYGMDLYVRIAMKKVFPELEFTEIPFDHPIYHQKFSFKNGLPKVHEHDKKPPQGFGLFYEGRLVCFYSYESDLGDGWEDQSVHNDPEDVRIEALKMGVNLIQFAFEQ